MSHPRGWSQKGNRCVFESVDDVGVGSCVDVDAGDGVGSDVDVGGGCACVDDVAIDGGVECDVDVDADACADADVDVVAADDYYVDAEEYDDVDGDD